jgi:hypothetical protein
MKNKNIFWLQNKNEGLIRILIWALTNTRSCSRSELSYLCIKTYELWISSWTILNSFWFVKFSVIFLFIDFAVDFFYTKNPLCWSFWRFWIFKKNVSSYRGGSGPKSYSTKNCWPFFLHITSPYLAILVFRLIFNIITYYPFSLYIVLK